MIIQFEPKPVPAPAMWAPLVTVYLGVGMVFLLAAQEIDLPRPVRVAVFLMWPLVAVAAVIYAIYSMIMEG